MSKEDFYQKVYSVVKSIPKGRVTTYGSIANFLGAAKSSRLVGYAMNNSHEDETIPSHRVVNRLGVLTGKHHFSSSFEMEQKLASEGLEIKEDRIINFKEVFWDPIKHI